jgi:hypothetical protein
LRALRLGGELLLPRAPLSSPHPPLSSSGSTGRSSIPETAMLESTGHGVLDRPPSRTMTAESAAPPSSTPQNKLSPSRDAHRVRVIKSKTPLMNRGRREGRELAAPVARLQKKTQAAVTTGSAKTSRPSLRDGLAAYSVLSPGTGLIAPVARVLVKAPLTWHQHRDARTTRLHRPHHTVRRHAKARCDVSRPTTPRLHVRDDRDTPLFDEAGCAQ